MVASGGFLWSAFGWGTMAGGKGFSSLVGASQIFFSPHKDRMCNCVCFRGSCIVEQLSAVPG